MMSKLPRILKIKEKHLNLECNEADALNHHMMDEPKSV